MNNYYDVATPAELEEHFGYVPSPEEVSEGRESCARDSDLNNQLLFWLFLDRGDKKTADSFLNKINDPSRRLDASMLAYECQPA